MCPGTLELFFLEKAKRWAVALGEAGADAVIAERIGSHGDASGEKSSRDGGVGVRTLNVPRKELARRVES